MIIHEITLVGYAVQCAERQIRLGTAGSYGVEALCVMRKGEWVDYDIIIAFHPPKGETVQIRLESDNVVAVPPEATAVAGTGELTFAGYADGVRQISVSQIYRVTASAGTEGIAPAEPTPELVQQILSAANEADSKAEQAQKVAQSVRDDADAGKFNGAQGEKGERGERGERGVQGIQGPPGEPGKDAPQEVILFTEQALDDAQKAQARENIGAADAARQNILVGSETGNPVGCNDAYSAPLCGLTVYGKSTQDGTPTPDAPVPIVSAGDGGSVTVTLSDGHGKTQTLTLPTPNGLPGIPVTAGGNYTDPQGQQWVCDEVDLERGVKVQRIYKVDIDGENVNFDQVGDYANLLLRGLPIALYRSGQEIFAISTFTSLRWYYNDQSQFLYLIQANISNQLNAACKKQLGKIYYALATPIETPLTPAEIAAYKALTAYAPDTVVQASDGAGVKLAYQRDVNITIKKLEDAIASMTAT